jgi:rfaE bifunctional protein nucleotidyltransferase chain/domain
MVLPNKKTFKINTLAHISADLKGRGLRIGLTHGAFDLFHSGHLYLLNEAAKVCDYLIVGIDSDQNVRSYKGNKRPYYSENERIDIISSLEFVDGAFIFSDEICQDAYQGLYKHLLPSSIIAGTNFAFSKELEEDASVVGASVSYVNKIVPRSTSSVIRDLNRDSIQREGNKINLPK